MLYTAYELGYAAMAPYRLAANFGAQFWRSPLNPAADTWFGRNSAAALDVFEGATRRYLKPEWDLDEATFNGEVFPVTEEVILGKDFCNLVRFHREGANENDPKVLIVAPLSGHHATLLRGTVEAMLPEHDVYITDWLDARLVPVGAGKFDMNDYIDYLIEFLTAIGPGAHSVAVCQPGPLLLAAASVMAEANDPYRPRSMTIMGSPIDTRKSPTVPNKLAKERPFAWFEQNMIFTVPAPHPGIMRRVYPGFVQLYSFMSMNSSRHINAHQDYFENLVQGDGDSAEKHRAFYDEYLSVLDMTEEFYLQTISEVFQKHSLADGTFSHNENLVKPALIKDIALLTVEGEKDDISGIGQTQAAHDLCSGLPAKLKEDYIQPGVGHYGVFNGSRWRTEIQPRVRDFIRKHDKGASPATKKKAKTKKA